MSPSSEPKGCWTTVERPARRVYIDAGANWANTLRLYRDELDKLSRFPVKLSASTQPWEIYAFEASPVIQPFVEDFVKHLNGLAPRPALLVPPIGSSRSHAQYSRMFNCTVSLTEPNPTVQPSSVPSPHKGPRMLRSQRPAMACAS